MNLMVNKLHLHGAMEIISHRVEDDRGYFSESYNQRDYHDIGIRHDFVQDNHSYSMKAGTIRGLHYQSPPVAQAKLIRVIKGSVLDVIVDFRHGSPSYQQWESVCLSAHLGNQLYVPEGYAHGFIAQEDNCELEYKVSNFYSPEHDAGIRWDDPELAIDWQLHNLAPILSEKDKKLPFLKQVESPFIFEQK